LKRVCIVSLRCAAGLQKEIDSLCAGFGRNGWVATQLLAEDYLAFLGQRLRLVLVKPNENGTFHQLEKKIVRTYQTI
jgi:hypothetical protein